MTAAISTVARILKKVSSSEKFPESSLPAYTDSLPAYKPMPKLQRESSLPRIEVERPRQLQRTNSAPSAAPYTTLSLHNETYERPGSGPDRTQKLLTNTKRVRGLRSFLWVKPHSTSGQAALLAQLVPVLAANLGCLSAGLSLGYHTTFLHAVTAQDPGPPGLLPAPVPGLGVCLWLGALLGVLLGPRLCARHGARRALILLCLPDLAGWLLLAGPPSLPALLLGRALTGLAAGGYLPTVQVLVGELAQPANRRALSLLSLAATGLGTLVIYNLGLLLPPARAALLCAFVPLLLALALACCRDSPRWLVAAGKDHEALQALASLRGGDSATAVSELVTIQRRVKEQEADTPDIVEGIRTIFRKHLDTFATISCFFFVMVFSGKFCIDLFSIQLFENVNANPICAVIPAFIYVIGCLSLGLLEKTFSPKTLYIFSSAVCGTALALFSLSVHHQAGSVLLPLLSLSLFMAAAPLGLTSLPLSLLPRAFPSSLQPLAASLLLALGCLHLLLASLLLPALQTAVGLPGLLWAQAATAFLGAPLALWLLPGDQPAKQRFLGPEDKFAGLRRDRGPPAWTGPLAISAI